MKTTISHRFLCSSAFLAFIASSLPSSAFSQDIGGIAGALIQGAINAQRMQQHQRYQRAPQTDHESRRSSRANRDSQSQSAKQQDEKNSDLEKQHEAFSKLSPAAGELIEDAATFVKENPSNGKLLDILQKVNELNSALASQNASKVKSLMEGLLADLRREPAYAKVEAERSKRRQLEAQEQLPDLLKTAKQQQTFLRYYVTNNPVTPYTVGFIGALKQCETILAAPEVDKLRASNSKIDVLIREAGLQDEFVKSMGVLAEQSAPTASSSAEQAAIRKSSKNAFLMDGNPKDFVLMYNSSPQAPHITKDLKGNIEFETGQATACLYQPRFPKSQIYLLTQTLLQYKLRKLDVDSSECPRTQLSTYDVIAVERGELAQLKPEISLPLHAELEAGRFKPLQTVTAAQIEELAQQQATSRKQIEDDIQRDAANGFGIVSLGSQVDAICMVVNSNEKGHRQVLLDNIERLTLELGSASPVPVSSATLQDAYKALQRRECQAIYSSAPELKNLMTALRKDDTSYSVSSVWVTDEKVEAAQKSIEEHELAAQKQDQERKAKADASKKLMASIAKSEMETSRKKQEFLQSQYGKVAAARSADIATVVREGTESRPDWQQTTAFGQFPKFTSWVQNLIKVRWELQSFNSEVFDYGRARWKDRAMETAFTKITVRLRNRILGEYQDACFLFGRMNDSEFDMVRDTIEIGCGNDAELSSWKRVRGFESQWIVEPSGS
jgi:hypothetical protein